MSDEYRAWPLKDIEAPLVNDVVYGRGGLANNHKGNRRFREMVCQFKDEYAKCSRHEKTAMAERLVQEWRGQSPPGRFIKMDTKTNLWYDVGSLARSKISQTLREGPLKNKDESKPDVVPPPPPPPPSASPPAPEEEEEVVLTPPQTRPARDLEKDKEVVMSSPTSVMNMPFFPVEDTIVKEAGRKIRRSSSRVSNFFEAIKLPGFPMRKQKQRRNDIDDAASVASECQQPPAKRPAFQNPLASFLGNLVQDKMGGTPTTVTIVQDNAMASPDTPMPQPVQTEVVVFAAVAEEQKVAAAKAPRRAPTPCTSNCAVPREFPVAPPRRITPDRRERSVERFRKKVDRKMPLFKPDFLDDSEHSLTWRNELEDMENNPMFAKYAEDLYDKTTTPKPTPIGTKNISIGSRTSIASGSDSLVEDLNSLHKLFRERCDTGTSNTSVVSAVDFFQQAYPDAKPHQMSFLEKAYVQQQQQQTFTMPPSQFAIPPNQFSVPPSSANHQFGSLPPPPPPPAPVQQQFDMNRPFAAAAAAVPARDSSLDDFDMMSLESFSDDEGEDPWGDDSYEQEQGTATLSFDNNTYAELMASST